MTFEEYQRLAQRTSSEKMQLIEKIENGLMGLNGEAGEAIDVLKKHKFQGHQLDRNKIIEELGDVLWYIAETCEGLGVSMKEVASFNIEKLKNRYPDGFSSDRSINRKKEG